MKFPCLCLFLLSPLFVSAADAPVQTEVTKTDDTQGRIFIEAVLKGRPEERQPLIFAAAVEQSIRASLDRLSNSFLVRIDVLQGEPKEIPLILSGLGEVRQVTGEGLQDWSIRQEAGGKRLLVLRPVITNKPPAALTVTIIAETELKELPQAVSALTIAPPQSSLFNGFVHVEAAPEVNVEAENLAGLVPIEPKFLPERMRVSASASEEAAGGALAFRFHGSPYTLPLRITPSDPEARRVVLSNVRLTGQLGDKAAVFRLTGTARVKNPKGGSTELLSGGAALTEVIDAPPDAPWRIQFDNGRFMLVSDKAGEFGLDLRFNATIRPSNGWNTIEFRVAPSVLEPVVLQGLSTNTQVRFAGAARPQRVGSDFVSYLPPSGQVSLAWKEMRAEGEGRLFYSAEMLCQLAVSPGLMRQSVLLEGKVMQGDLQRVVLNLRGTGKVTLVQGDQVLSWNEEGDPNAAERRLVVQFNQPQKQQFTVQIQVQSALGTFPQAFEPVQVRPEGATRFDGYFRIVNDGAVRLEVVQASGLSQIAPEQFPETAITRALFPAAGNQRFVFRFSGAAYQLRIQADNVLPELSVSQLLAYHLGDNELIIDTEIELDIREAPVRELVLRVPKGFAVARLNAAHLNDYFLQETEAEADAQLRLVFGQPISGRQVVQLRLERNRPLGAATWTLPRIEVVRAKSVRGHLAVSADAGFRLTPATTEGLTEIATAFFPRKVAGIQAAFRISEPAWQATLRVERLPQSIQVDAIHLFSIGERIAYGSSVLSYLISGAPIGRLRVELSAEYFNVEFTGKDVRNWQKTETGYEVQLHSPVSGSYTLLATYERPFRGQGETLTFTGARPLDAQTEQGHTIVVSAYQFQVKPVNVSPGLLALEPGEVPPEYRLLFDAPVLAAYRYTARPFNLQLALSPLAQGDTLNQVADRASLVTRISKEGQVLTDARYFVKNRGQSHLRLTLPEGTRLWSATVNGARAVPVIDGKDNLIPLPQANPNATHVVELKLATRSAQAKQVTVGAPIVATPVLLAEWKIEPDTGQRLVYRSGTLVPVGGVTDVSGFAGLVRLFGGADRGPAAGYTIAAIGLLVLALLIWRWASQPGVYRLSARQVIGSAFGLVALVLAVIMVVALGNLAEQENQFAPRGVTFVAPVQEAGATHSAQVANLPAEVSVAGQLGLGWPALLAVGVWLYALVAAPSRFRTLLVALGWTLLAWAALKWPNGAPWFFTVVVLFLLIHWIGPAFRRLWQLPPRPPAPPATGPATAPVTALWLVAALILLGAGGAPSGFAQAATTSTAARKGPALAESVAQQVRVEDSYAFVHATVRWVARKDQTLPLLFEPAVLTRISYPSNALRLIATAVDAKRGHQLLAQQSGAFDLEFDYQVQVTRREGESGLALPTQFGLVNVVALTLPDLEVEVNSPQAVSVEQELTAQKGSTARLVLAPVREPWIGWKPRSRDRRREKVEFYAELAQLYLPLAGVIEGEHLAQIRPAQGELSELIFHVPAGATITDVIDPSGITSNTPPRSSIISVWRFDPDARRLRVTLNPPQSRPFSLLIRSQVAAGPLPYEQTLGLISVTNAAGQLGLIGIATGSEVQLDTVTADLFSPILLEDFPNHLLQRSAGRISGLTLRRAYRYVAPQGALVVKATAVEPDVRVEAQQTLSLGEDRAVLAANLAVDITRAGVFRLSFLLPAGMDVESISGGALSHWTELRAAEGRIITLHLRGKTEGQQPFAITVAGPGVQATKGYVVPKLTLREASKQRGQLLVVPEQGLRLQVAAREGVTQLDPTQAGARQKGVLAFRTLQAQWSLTLDLEQVEPWVQVTSLQHVSVNEAQLKVTANLQYQIENTGLKTLRVRLAANAEGVRFRGEQVADFLARVGQAADGMQEWEVKLHRRIIGSYLLQAVYQVPVPQQARETAVRGVEAVGVNLQRGFLTVQAASRLQVRTGAFPAALQPTEWQSIPRALRQDLEAAPASLAYRLVEPSFQLPLTIERHEAAQLLPARVNQITLTSVISDDGVMLTQVRLELLPGDKRLLHLTLPTQARFWFGFVNDKAVWPWLEQDRILLPLEVQSRNDQPSAVEFFYSSRVAAARGRALDLELLGPKFDLPLENITWKVFLNEKWKVKDWTGSLQLSEERVVPRPVAVDAEAYLLNEAARQKEKSREAEQLLQLGNTLLSQGEPQQARRAFQSAYGLSQHDAAFNEDARVQLHNLKMQQALVGLSVRQSTVAGETAATLKPREVPARKPLSYTQDEAKQIIDRNAPEENTALMRLAERLIQQQDAAVPSASAIRASIPEQGRMLTFRRSVQVDQMVDLRIRIEAVAARAASVGMKLLLLLVVFVVLAAITAGARAWTARRVGASAG